MGTNYYTTLNNCDKCARYDQIHLGKSSGGWQFSFQYNGGKFYKNIPEMKKWLKGKEIKDEYDDIISYKDFWKMVEEKQKEINNHALSFASHGSEQVIGGYSFSDCEFS